MDRRNFLNMMVGGVATAAVRAWPFRAFSFAGPADPLIRWSGPIDPMRLDLLDLGQWTTGYFPALYGAEKTGTGIMAMHDPAARLYYLCQNGPNFQRTKRYIVSKSRHSLDG